MRAAAIALGAAVVLAFVPRWWAPAAAFVIAVLAVVVLDRAVLRSALRLGLVLAALFAAAMAGAAVAWASGMARGLTAGSTLLFRLLVLWLVTGVASRAVDSDALMAAARRLGMERLGLIFGLALNAMPRLVSAARSVWISYRMRSPSAIAMVPRLPAMAEVLLAHTARIADDAAAAAALRGHAALLRPREANLSSAAPVVVVTGRRDTGKTSTVLDVIARLIAEGRQVAGLVQPGEFRDGAKVGFKVRDLRSGREAPLAQLVERDQGDHGTRFRFDERGLALAEQALAAVPSGAVLVVDELGPVELRGRGHMPSLRGALATAAPEVVVLVVRRHLVPSLLAALSATDAVVVDVEAERENAARAVFAAVIEAELGDDSLTNRRPA